jgi:hypothetical protein
MICAKVEVNSRSFLAAFSNVARGASLSRSWVADDVDTKELLQSFLAAMPATRGLSIFWQAQSKGDRKWL